MPSTPRDIRDDRSPPRAFGLATKITLPFLALFALLLLLLGVVLAREILAEVEARVEDEQRFVLKVATYQTQSSAASRFPLSEEHLRKLRDQAAHQGRPPTARSEFVVLERGETSVTTFSREDTAAQQTIKALQDAFRNQPQEQSTEAILRRDLTLHGKKWMVLYTNRNFLNADNISMLAMRMDPLETKNPTPMVLKDFYLLFPFHEVEAAKNRALLRIVGLGGAGLLLAAALGLVIAQWIARPVRRLALAARRISAGGLSDVDIDFLQKGMHLHAQDEIGELTLAFRIMVESLKKSQDELLKAERLAVTGKLAASVAHEIRNPLTSLRMTVQMLQQRGANADAATQEAYKIVLSEIDRLALAVEELLTFARPRPAQRKPTDVNALVADTLKFLERQLAHARVAAVQCADTNLPAAVNVDANKIRQLLVNLILNAQQAIVRDGTVTVKTIWNAAARELTLSVHDTGPGIKPEVRDKVFELFVSTKDGGGGVGLAVAKQIAEEHRGKIWFESTPQGATFFVTIPADLPEGSPAAAA